MSGHTSVRHARSFRTPWTALRSGASRRTVRTATLAVVLALLVGATWLAIDGARRVADARESFLSARTELLAAESVLSPAIGLDAGAWPTTGEYDAARARLGEAGAHLRHGRARLGWLEGVADALGWLPRWGASLGHASEALDVADELVVTADRLLEITAPLFGAGPFGAEGEVIPSAREVLVERGEALAAELAALAQLGERVDRLLAMEWRWPFSTVTPTLERLDGELASVAEGQQLVSLLRAGFDPLLGFDGEPAHFLVLGQNDHEIRATGGFIGTIGLLTVVEGEVASADYRSSYDFSPRQVDRTPPEAMAYYFGASQWHPRDANWWPDFATSSEAALTLVAEDAGLEAEHVLAIDTTMVGLLLRALGPVTVAEFAEPLTEQNWLTSVEGALGAVVYVRGEANQFKDARGAYLQPVMQELLARAQTVPRDRLPALLAVIEEGIRGRHLQLYSRDPDVQALAARFGADGAMTAPPAEDFVAVIDTNLSYSKIQPAIRRDITYLAREDGITDLVVTWRNDLAGFAGIRHARLGTTGLIWDPVARAYREAPGTFGNYARLYLPPGAEVLRASGFDGPPRYQVEGGLAVVAGFVEVGVGVERTVRLSYRAAGPPSPGPSSPAGPPAVTFWKQGGQSGGTLRILRNAGDTQLELFRGPLRSDIRVPLR